jgi:hypothetical protein
VWRARFEQINDFERMLAANDVTILKFFLHISRKEQRERLIDRLEDPTENWKFRADDLDDRRRWGVHVRVPGCPAEVQHEMGAVVHGSGRLEDGPQLSDHENAERDAA